MSSFKAYSFLQALVTLLKYWDGGTSERNKVSKPHSTYDYR